MKNQILAIAFFASPLLIGCDRTPVDKPVAPTTTGTVTIKIDTGDELQSFDIPDVASGTTVETVMRKFDKVPVEITGSGTTAFVNGIGDVKTSESKGWTFRVNDKFASQGIGNTPLTPPATVHWKFGDWDQE